MKKLSALLILLFALVANSMASVKTSITITVNGQQRSMIVYTPNQMQNNLPLMIVTHGMNQSPEYQSVGDAPNYDGGDRLWELIDTEKFICVYLRSDGGMWDIGGDKDVNFVSQTIDEMYSRYKIDRNRVYWSGFSMGSMLIYNGIKKIADKIAAFAPTSGVKFDLNPANELRAKGIKVNLIHHHSNQDGVFPIGQYKPYEYVQQIAQSNGSGTPTAVSYSSQEGNYRGTKTTWKNSEGNEVVCFMYDGGGHWPSWYNRKEIWSFCKRFSKGNKYPLSGEGTYVKTTKNVTLTQTDDNTAKCSMSTSNGVTTFTTINDGDIEVIYKMLNVDVTDYNKVIVTFAEPTPNELRVAFGSFQTDIPEGTTTYTYDIPSGTTSLSEIALISLWKPQGTTIKVKSVELEGQKYVEEKTTSNSLNVSDFYSWSAADESGEKKNTTGCALEIGKSTGMPFGDGSVYYLNYADLSNLDKLVVTAKEGEPRFLFNRLENEGYVNVELPRDKAEYETVIDNGDGSKTYIVDIAKIVYDFGFAHLHAIKGANWANTTVTSIQCKDMFSLLPNDFNPNIWEKGKYEYNASTGVGSFCAGQYGFGGWHKDEGFDVSNYSKITVDFYEAPSDGVSFRLFDVNNYWTDPITQIGCDGKTSVSYDISDVDRLYFVGFWAYGSTDLSKSPMKIKSVTLTPKPFVANDVNADGTADLMDVNTLSDMLIGKSAVTRRADINREGHVNLVDLTTLINGLR